MTELLPILLKITVIIFMVGNLLELGLRIDLKKAMAGLRDMRFVTLSLLWAFVLCPALAYLLGVVLDAKFGVGDSVRVHTKVVEGDKERIQVFQGVVVRKRKGKMGATFTVRKVSYGIRVERIFPLHSPNIDRVEVVSKGKVRRGRLYYMRGLKGKAARIKEKRA